MCSSTFKITETIDSLYYTQNQTSDDICKLVKMGDQLLDRAQAEELYNCLAAKKGERAKRSIYNFDNLPNFKWSFPIRYRVTDDFSECC